MPDVLMELLEKLVMQTSNTAFSRNTNLQNLLVLTAIGAAPDRVMEYIRRLDNYDGPDIAPSCISAGLFEEAYTIYYKFEKFDDALDVLLVHLKDFSRAEEFAVRMNRPDVWLKLGIAQLENGIVADGIRSLINARDISRWDLVVQASRDDAEDNMDLLDALTDVEEFLVVGGHKANLEEVGDRCFDIELYHAAKMMFRAVPCWGKLAHTHIMLKEYKEAVYAAKKADRIPTWRIVCFGCVDGLHWTELPTIRGHTREYSRNWQYCYRNTEKIKCSTSAECGTRNSMSRESAEHAKRRICGIASHFCTLHTKNSTMLPPS